MFVKKYSDPISAQSQNIPALRKNPKWVGRLLDSAVVAAARGMFIVCAGAAVLGSLFLQSAFAQSVNDLERDLVIRLEYRGGCAECPSYVLGFFADGASYFRGIEAVRGLAVRGSFLRRAEFYTDPSGNKFQVSLPFESIKSNRSAIEGLLETFRANYLLDAMGRSKDLFCSKEATEDQAPYIDLKINWRDIRLSGSFCIGAGAPLIWRQFVALIVALYEYPEDFTAVPSFSANKHYVVRFALMREHTATGFDHLTCRGAAIDYVIYLRADGSLTIVGRRGAIPGHILTYESMTTTEFREQVIAEIKLLENRMQVLIEARPFERRPRGPVSSSMAGWPELSLSLHVKDGSGSVFDVSKALSDISREAPNELTMTLLSLGGRAAKLLPAPAGFQEYCRSLRPPY